MVGQNQVVGAIIQLAFDFDIPADVQKDSTDEIVEIGPQLGPLDEEL